jgi:uncharacterized protein YbaP (TraB family)
MKKFGFGMLMAMVSIATIAQQNGKKDANTLLWEISGNGLQKPSYLFGTIHMICQDDALLSDSLKDAIRNSDVVYLEVDMDNLFEMIGVLRKMQMRNDTTLADLLSHDEYAKVKSFFEEKGSLLPFSTVETYKPLLAASMLMESGNSCPSPKAMEEVIMQEAKSNNKRIKGLESMAYQMSIFDSIPYKAQAQQLVKYVENSEAGKNDDQKEYDKLLDAYKAQDLSKLQLLTKSDAGVADYSDLLLYNRNRNWVEKLKILMADKSLVIAVGAGHLPGEKGVISLLRKAGYTVKPVPNKVRTGNQI